MECKAVQKIIDGYLDNELDPFRALGIEDHLHGCVACSRSYQERRALRDGVRSSAVYFNAPEELRQRIQRSLRQAAGTPSTSRRMSWQWIRVAAPLAAAALVALMLIPVFRGPSPESIVTQEVVSSHIRSLMANHLADVPSSDQHTVKPWFDGKLDFSPPVSDLAKEGFPLIGGRLDYLDNRPVAALVYRRDKHVINVFVWPAGTSAQASGSVKTQQGYNVIRWTAAGMNFWVVSDLERNQLAKFTDLLKSSASTSPSQS
jgi:anti-sigma factor RsiW